MYTKAFGKGLAAAIVTVGVLSCNFGVVSAQTLDDETTATNQQTLAPVSDSCVDGSNRDNLTYKWDQTGTVSVSTKDGKLICGDETIYLSSYSLPATYDNSGIFDDSSVPQQLFDSSSVVLEKGTTGEQTLHVKVPDTCQPYQLDLYYAPEITTVGYHGHEGQLVYGRIYLTSEQDCSPAPGRGGDTDQTVPPVETPVTPVTPVVAPVTTPVVVPVVAPAAALQAVPVTAPAPAVAPAAQTSVVLPNTGSNTNLLNVAFSLLTTGATALVAPFIVRKRA